MTEEITKTLGQTSYKNSKQKKKIQAKKDAGVKKVKAKDGQLKVKIKNLGKELERIAKIESGSENKKVQSEKKVIEEKLVKLKIANSKLQKEKPALKKEKPVT
ncbi:MAG: hypothetical protein ACJAW3_000553 [Lentimonas sp.]|jgi:hypothetical protein